MLGHTTVVLFLLTLAYFVVPLRFDWEESWTLGRLATALAALALLGLAFRRRLRKSREHQTEPYLRIQWLLSALYALVLTFALVYAALASLRPDQFVGLDDRTDALYFSVTIVATVGFGDIHAADSLAQLLVTLHMLFNLIYLGTALRVLTGGRPLPPPERGEGPA
jgi:hypothetical protein